MISHFCTTHCLTGKTLQTIALVCHLKESFGVKGPSLIVCPLTVLYSWCNEITKWAPGLSFLRFHSSNPGLESQSLDWMEYDMVVTTYEMCKAPQLRHLFSVQHWNLCVLDEGHRIKSAETQISQAVRKIHCEIRVILTGTPLANNLVELHSLLQFLNPDIFTTNEPFAAAFDLTLNLVDPVKLKQAHALLKMFMLRRLKQEVEKLMPPKIETKVLCPLSNTQIWFYKALLLKDLNLLSGSAKVNKAKALSNLVMQLRKCCIHPFLFDGVEEPDTTTLEELVGASGKLSVLDQLLRSLYKKKHRVVLFSQFTRVLDILEDYCTLRGWNFCRFDGGTARAKRNFVVNSFNAPDSDKFIFLMSTRSGGMGLNLQVRTGGAGMCLSLPTLMALLFLQTADTCILFDSDWNPQPDIQGTFMQRVFLCLQVQYLTLSALCCHTVAMARVHRIGQTKTVHVYRLVTDGTVEQRMVERAEKKLYLDRMVTQDGVAESVNDNDDENADRLLSTLRFGCNAVFGSGEKKQALPSDEDIEVITDRARSQDFSLGNLKGGVDSNAKDFDATQEFKATTDLCGIDFARIRKDYTKKKRPKDIGALTNMWKKRERKSRIKMVSGHGSGYGSEAVPILAVNDYDLMSGEKSVFDRELQGRHASAVGKKKMKGPSFTNQDFCQVCFDGGELVLCPRCPVSLHLSCAGIRKPSELLCCSLHHCTVCDKPASIAGGFLFVCASACTKAFCEDHLPHEARTLGSSCSRYDRLNYSLKHGVFVHCSKQCEDFSKKELSWVPPSNMARPPCPPTLNLVSSYGGEVDDCVDTPGENILTGKRQRQQVNYADSQSPPKATALPTAQKPAPSHSSRVHHKPMGHVRGLASNFGVFDPNRFNSSRPKSPPNNRSQGVISAHIVKQPAKRPLKPPMEAPRQENVANPFNMPLVSHPPHTSHSCIVTETMIVDKNGKKQVVLAID